jgi:hypothetical protein
MQTITNAVEAVLGVIVLVLAPLVMVDFWNQVTRLACLGGW